MSSKKHRKWSALMALLMTCSLILSACGEEEPEVIEKEVTRVVKETVVETVVEKETVKETVVEKETVLQTVVEKETIVETVVEEIVVTATPEPAKGPAVGGTMVFSMGDFEGLDTRKVYLAASQTAGWFLGSTLVAKDVDGNYVPWLAESWTTSDDGLVWEFKLRKDVKFHDGTPMTAHDYAWSIMNLLDPELGTPQRGRVAAINLAEAVDDYTLRLTLSAPYPILLEQLSNTGIVQPLKQEIVEELGDQIARQPLAGVGPYRFKEWQTGEKVVLERNPDFQWAPEFARQGPYYIEFLEFRIIGEYATTLAGLEAGEIDHAGIEPKDVQRIRDTGEFDIIESLELGWGPCIHMNLSVPPLDDVNVRRALNLAVDRETLIRVVAQGQGVIQHGPLSPNITGYWPGVEEISYGYDLDQARALMAEAGWTDSDGDGVLDKDGEPLHFVLKILAGQTQLAEFLQQQYKELGVDIELQIVDDTLLFTELIQGDYVMLISSVGFSDSDLPYRWFSSTREGALNPPQHSDAELDMILDATRTTVDPAERQEWLNKMQEYIVDQAYIVFLYLRQGFIAVNKRIKGYTPNPREFLPVQVYLYDAYIEEE